MRKHSGKVDSPQTADARKIIVRIETHHQGRRALKHCQGERYGNTRICGGICLDKERFFPIIAVTVVVKNGALGHVVLNVANLKKSESFYRAILGMQISARNRKTKMTFLSFGREHHDVALQELPRGTKHETGGSPKLHHFCIYVKNNDEVDALYPVLRRRKISIVSGPEILEVAGNRSISFLDPDGNRVEVACNAKKFKFDRRKK